MVTCPKPEDLHLLLEGALNETELAAISSHLDRCPNCREALDRLSSDADSRRWRSLRQRQKAEDEPSAELLSRIESVVSPSSWKSATTRPFSAVLQPFAPTGYEILAELGRGGVGVVYKARHKGLSRVVALKVLLAGHHAGADDRARFQAEAEAAARLQHPGIVQIYEVGEYDSRPYLALEFVEGSSLSRVAHGTPQDPRTAAELVELLAQAVQYAHERGVIHRDLKPSNVLLQRGATSTPKITDFGMAKLLDAPERTETGHILGTPGYMAPEQARGQSKSVGPAADIYALGAILYELLTGRAPFQGVTPVDTVVQVLHDEPVPPRRLQPKVPRDLETICLKCLRKEPAARYESAGQLANDLRRFLDGRPVLARRVGLLDQGWRWCTRNPALAGLAAALVLAIVGGFAGITWGYLRAEDARKQEAVARENEARHRDQAELALYYSRIALAEREWLANDVARAEYLLDRCLPGAGYPDRRGFEWHYLKRLCHADLLTFHAHREHIRGITYTPDGKHLITAAGTPDYARTGQERGDLALWKTTGQLVGTFQGTQGQVVSVTLSRDGERLLAVCSNKKAYLWEMLSRRKLAEFDAQATYWQGASGDFSPDGNTLAIPNLKSVELRKVENGALVGLLTGYQHAGMVTFNKDGRCLASTDRSGAIRVWDVVRRTELWQASGGPDAIAFSPDGQWLAFTDKEFVKVYDISGREVTRLRGHNGTVRALAWLPSGKQLATASNDQTVRLWDVTTGREDRVYRGHQSPVLAVACSPDGRYITSGDANGLVKMWDAGRDQRAVMSLVTPDTCAVSFAAASQQIIAAWLTPGNRAGIRAFDSATGALVYEHSLPLAQRVEWPLKYVDFSADGSLIASPSGPEQTDVAIWQTATGKEVARLNGHKVGVRVVAFSADGRRLATAAWDRKPQSPGELILWELDEAWRGTPRFSFSTTAPIQCLAYSPDGRRLFAGDRGCFVPGQTQRTNGTITVWDADTGQQLRSWSAHHSRVQTLAVSSDGQTVASAAFGEEGGLRIWDCTTGELRYTLKAPPAVTVVRFSQDGHRLAVAGYEGTVQLWDPKTGQDILSLRGPGGQIPENQANDTDIAFSPDGTRLAVNCWTKTVHVFDASPIRQPSASQSNAAKLEVFP